MKRDWWLSLSLCLGSMALMCIAAEVVARICLPPPLPWLLPQSLYENSPSLGFRYKPNQSTYTADKLFRTNAMGLRGPATTWQKPPGIRRILLLGDSITQGFGVREEDTFAQQLEVLLNETREINRYEVLNAGVGAYNTTQEVLYFHEEGINFEPDLVILGLYWNDITDSRGVYANSNGDLVLATFSGEQSSMEKLWNSSPSYTIRNLLKKSLFLYFITDRIRQLQAQFAMNNTRRHQMSVLSGQYNASIASGWNDVEDYLVKLANTCKFHDIRLLVAILPMPQQLAKYHHDIQYQSVAKSVCQRNNIRCLDLLPAFEKAYTTHSSLFINYDGDHPNERGHALIARELHRTITDGFFPSPHREHAVSLPPYR